MNFKEALIIVINEGKLLGNCRPLLQRPYREDPSGVVRECNSEYERAKGFVEGYRRCVEDISAITLKRYAESHNSNGPLFGIYEAAQNLLKEEYK